MSVGSAPPPQAPAADRTAPTATILGIRGGQRFARRRAPRELRGRASADPSGLWAVKLRLTRRLGGTCWYFSGSKERFLKRTCGKQHAFKVAEATDWSYLLPSSLPRGRYEQVPRGLRNVIGQLPGSKPAVVVAAHYDTKAIPGFVGANDAAGGTAAVLELARVLRRTKRPAGAPELRFVVRVVEMAIGTHDVADANRRALAAHALRERVALLGKLEESAITRCLTERIRPNPGAATVVRTMRARGAMTLLVSGGFTAFAQPVAAMLGFERVEANVLEASEGRPPYSGKRWRPCSPPSGPRTSPPATGSQPVTSR